MPPLPDPGGGAERNCGAPGGAARPAGDKLGDAGERVAGAGADRNDPLVIEEWPFVAFGPDERADGGGGMAVGESFWSGGVFISGLDTRPGLLEDVSGCDCNFGIGWDTRPKGRRGRFGAVVFCVRARFDDGGGTSFMVLTSLCFVVLVASSVRFFGTEITCFDSRGFTSRSATIGPTVRSASPRRVKQVARAVSLLESVTGRAVKEKSRAFGIEITPAVSVPKQMVGSWLFMIAFATSSGNLTA